MNFSQSQSISIGALKLLKSYFQHQKNKKKNGHCIDGTKAKTFNSRVTVNCHFSNKMTAYCTSKVNKKIIFLLCSLSSFLKKYYCFPLLFSLSLFLFSICSLFFFFSSLFSFLNLNSLKKIKKNAQRKISGWRHMCVVVVQ